MPGLVDDTIHAAAGGLRDVEASRRIALVLVIAGLLVVVYHRGVARAPRDRKRRASRTRRIARAA